tara:strand:- start:1323 stop:2369 length:1047 start_codon:yes stop_codon:yes gene_type:complete
MPVSWGSVTEHNRYMYVAEEQSLLTVTATATRVYLRETLSGVVSERIATLAPAVYDGLGLATQLQTALSVPNGPQYAATYTSSQTSLGTIALAATAVDTIEIMSREFLLTQSSWAGTTLVKHDLQDASDVLGTTATSLSGNPLTITLGHGLVYRQIPLSLGSYTATALAAEMTTQLNSGVHLGTYTAQYVSATGRMTVTNTATPLKFHWYTEGYLDAHPYAFPGHIAPLYTSDSITGLTGTTVLEGNSITGTAHVDTQAYHTLFIACSLGLHTDSVGPMGQTSIARKIVIDNPSMVHDFHSQAYDYIQLEPQNISSIHFRVTDWKGQTIQGLSTDWSLSIIMVPHDQM